MSQVTRGIISTLGDWSLPTISWWC